MIGEEGGEHMLVHQHHRLPQHQVDNDGLGILPHGRNIPALHTWCTASPMAAESWIAAPKSQSKHACSLRLKWLQAQFCLYDCPRMLHLATCHQCALLQDITSCGLRCCSAHMMRSSAAEDTQSVITHADLQERPDLGQDLVCVAPRYES